MKFVLWMLWQVLSPVSVGCSTIVLVVVFPILAFVWLVFVYQTSF